MAGSWKDKLIEFLENNRGLVVLIFCLPASFVFDVFLNLYVKLLRLLAGSSNKHSEKVKQIQKKIQIYNKTPSTNRKLLVTARPNWLSLSTKFFQKDKCHQIPINLYDILNLDEENLTVHVEPMVTVGEITKYLIPKGYTLAVTLEIADATLGGLAMGTGMTTHSHKVGLYHENVVSYEVVLGDGSLVTASKDENSDLYKVLPWSHGSLGFLVALTLKIVKVKPYIKMSYIPVKGQGNYCDMIRLFSGDTSADYPTPDYVEATIFNKDEAVIMTGEFSDYDSTLSINHLTRWYKPWFYKYVESFISKGKYTELIPLREYLLRHNRAIFWVVESMIPFGNNMLFRLFFGWLLPPKPAFLKFTTTPGVRAFTFTRQVFQDIVLPIRKLEDQINESTKLFDLYPLLVYPCRIYDHGPHSGQLKPPPKEYLVEGTNYSLYNDLGIYGVPGFVRKKEKYNPVANMRAMEKFTRDVGGFSFLYADIFMNRSEFEEMFDLALYESVRSKYAANGAFPDLYDKVKPEIDVFDIGREYEIK
ncbi:delta(24)-sterol reductase-like [Cylas formicarius]|uniref:delta(24)-sterol reductase-like n=1 Tax=Cylas formicarius TaxID=197179 RepID=UPI0029589EB5|nr:delta(24)-sterol reductase-like [Cylas formicarius]XP_060533691.1 delta(24)-sterol reductase-like [Cylas formicarius]XP_060533700.1 delta(24)-sterol reductase-like [Cylas formicarius]XP_060533709.1 delta(24)-sterol reductase-like [Cylas formicarius]XP_060533716.1 delta(24)-sterol reductase-like [Cylas formicarius]